MKPTHTNVQIPLNKLVLHPRNVRAGSPNSYSEDQIKPLAANIQAHGLLQPLIVQQLEDGAYPHFELVLTHIARTHPVRTRPIARLLVQHLPAKV